MNIVLLGLFFKKDIDIFFITGGEGLNVFKIPCRDPQNNNENPIKLILATDGYFDVAYPKKFISTAGIMQSIIYDVQYFQVLKFT